jgi:hypothetical protein
MAPVDVEVRIPKLGPPDFSLTATLLGQRSGPPGHGGRPDVWEMVRLTNGKVSLDPQDIAQIGRCNFVKNLFIRIDFGLEYFVASDLRDNINNAANAGQTRLADFFHQLLRREP